MGTKLMLGARLRDHRNQPPLAITIHHTLIFTQMNSSKYLILEFSIINRPLAFRVRAG